MKCLLARFFREYRRRIVLRDYYDERFQFRDWDEVSRLQDEEPWLR